MLVALGLTVFFAMPFHAVIHRTEASSRLTSSKFLFEFVQLENKTLFFIDFNFDGHSLEPNFVRFDSIVVIAGKRFIPAALTRSEAGEWDSENESKCQNSFSSSESFYRPLGRPSSSTNHGNEVSSNEKYEKIVYRIY